jgi:hypothetical protein
VTVSFLVQKLFSLCSPICSLFLLDADPFEFLFRKLFPIPVCSNVFPTASGSCFKVSGLMLRSLIHFELILVQMKDRDLVSVFYIWRSSFPSSVC